MNEDARTDAPQKYIRTFAGDQETLKSGGKPNLAPLVQAPAPPPASGAPVTQAPVPAAPKVEQAPVAPVPSPKPAPPELSPIHTYSGDFSSLVKDSGASRATILAAEQDAGQEVRVVTPRERAGSALYVIAGAILLGVGAGGVYYAYDRYVVQTAPAIITPVVAAPIFVDERQEIAGTDVLLMQAIQQSLTRPLAAGAVRFLYTQVATTTDQSVFSALQLPAPGGLLRNIQAKGSMAGIVNADESSPFFILSVSSYSDTFAGMLAWEPTLVRDVAQLYPAHTAQVASTTATSTSAFTIKTTPGFFDEVISNHDARIYRDAEGRGVVVYGYWDATTLVIARDKKAFTEILQRLATSRTAQ